MKYISASQLLAPLLSMQIFFGILNEFDCQEYFCTMKREKISLPLVGSEKLEKIE
jgi:hypothetical protein